MNLILNLIISLWLNLTYPPPKYNLPSPPQKDALCRAYGKAGVFEPYISEGKYVPFGGWSQGWPPISSPKPGFPFMSFHQKLGATSRAGVGVPMQSSAGDDFRDFGATYLDFQKKNKQWHLAASRWAKKKNTTYKFGETTYPISRILGNSPVSHLI